MQRTYDVAVIGAGVMGLRSAIELSQMGAGEVALLERKFPGAGESGKSGAILRQHYSHIQLIRMARASLSEFAIYADRTGVDIGFERPGILLLFPEADRATLEAILELQRAEGVDTTLLETADLRRLDLRGRYDGVIGAWEPEAGFVDPVRTLAGFMAEARAAGVTIELECEVHGVLVEGSEPKRVVGLETSHGRIAARTVVAATGPWSARLLAPLGITLPLEVVRPEQAFLRAPASGAHPIIADMLNQVYWKPERGMTRVGRVPYDNDERVADPDAYDESVSNGFLQEMRERVARRLPDYSHAVIWGGGAALYTVTPDAQAVIGPLDGLDGFWLVTGFSGHGFKLSPSVGRGVAEWIVHGAPSAFDATFFDAQRFARAAARRPSAYRYKLLG